MTADLDSGDEISRLTEGLLRDADAVGRWPTPVDDIVAAAKLDEPAESPFDASILARAPRYLRHAVALVGRSEKIRALLDRRERTVHIAPGIDNEGRRAFLRLHEVTHDLLPWQAELAYADSDATLSWRTNKLFEREANQGAAELLFQGERFRRMAGEYRIGMGAVADLKNKVGSSLRATLRRYSEGHSGAVCGIVLEASPRQRQPLAYRRLEVSQSTEWTARFGNCWPAIIDEQSFPFLATLSNGGAEMTFTLTDVNLAPTEIRIESRSSRYGHLLLLWLPRREVFKRKRVLARAA